MKLNKDQNTQWIIDQSNSTQEINDNVVLHVRDNSAIFEAATIHDNKYIIQGSVIGPSGAEHAAIESDGKDGRWMISYTATVSGYYGFVARGNGTNLENAGNIHSINDHALLFLHGKHTIANGGSIGIATDMTNVIELRDGDYKFSNGGQISGQEGIVARDSDLHLENNGSIQTFDFALAIVGKGSLSLKNVGSIESETLRAVSTGSQADRIDNFGRIHGTVDLGGGDDSFTNATDSLLLGDVKLGAGDDTITLNGVYVQRTSFDFVLAGGQGDDVFNLGSNDVIVTEGKGGGEDRITTYISHSLERNVENLTLLGRDDTSAIGNELDNVLTGSNADNALSGGEGDDQILGRGGMDTLVGGAGNDIFHFATGDKTDTISDWQDGSDVIDLSKLSGIADFNDLIANHSEQVDEAVIISAGKDKLTLLNTDLGTLTADEFTF